MHLIPAVARQATRPGRLFVGKLETIKLPVPLSESLLMLAGSLADEMAAAVGSRPRIVPADCPVPGGAVEIVYDPAMTGLEHYTLEVQEQAVVIRSKTERGCFYGMQTLRQLIRGEGALLPLTAIDDEPCFPNRGFYHDCTRSKVPTLATLMALVDKLAYYKINQLQLYIEHTFAFAGHSDIWAGCDPLTAEEILQLDRHCRLRQVELVPSLSTFGHFYMVLRSKRKEHLNELPVNASELPFSYHDRMAHYTLDCLNPESLELVRKMLAEFIPLFSSRYFNICCDETFDLGKGRNRAAAEAAGGAGKLYLDFLRKVIDIVGGYGKTAMFWGDVILETPELIKALPPGTIALDWDYSMESRRNDTGRFQAAEVPFYVCPGVSGWNQCVANIVVASANITSSAVKGKKFGAIGLLNTDWGDHGHINPLGTSFHGLAHGAAAGWNPEAALDFAAFDRDFEVLELGLPSGGFCALWREFFNIALCSWWHVQVLFDPSLGMDSAFAGDVRKATAGKLPAAIAELEKLLVKLTAALSAAAPLDPLEKAELLVGFQGQLLMHKIILALQEPAAQPPWRTADELRRYERDLSDLWHRRNRPGEYFRFRSELLQIGDALDALGRSGN
ncbi:glycoside hydrolase family 20 zincin-like fold domain-containing protein [Victivallis sp. Marseille-Q1083]|uniref:glycoside hydrolase family 20 zincin-like fold domain-containing protein n=1 Tax=Victivallis sp. Marseille-Q1083 TaxID=2717288 RepID=UPI00158D8152|nr:glycoside hydrolase family 20 zincin-like fold domain-containing protein [Victivallis sp. Marseille-Q1083]